MELAKKIALVTGGASGMGKACVERLVAADVQVVVWDKQPVDNQEAILSLGCNVASAEDVEQALQTTIAQIGVPQICINCAGIAPAARMVGKAGAMSLAAFKEVIDVNLIGTFNVMRVVATAMAQLPLADDATERGIIINTASIAAFEGQIGQIAYSASKGGVVAMTLPAARELAQHAIRINTIAPGLIETPLLLNMPQNVQDNLAATVTFPKRLGKPTEFASLVLHLIENNYFNGAVIRLDGALRMEAS